jgi:hypothetical protein
MNAFRNEKNAFTQQILAVKRSNEEDLLLQMILIRARKN